MDMNATEVLFIADDLPSINIAWRHFAYPEYSIRATTHVKSGMECFDMEKKPQAVVYYCSEKSKQLAELYQTLRTDSRSKKVPLIVLADPAQQKTLIDYIKLENTQVLGISIDDRKLIDIIRRAVRKSLK